MSIENEFWQHWENTVVVIEMEIEKAIKRKISISNHDIQLIIKSVIDNWFNVNHIYGAWLLKFKELHSDKNQKLEKGIREITTSCNATYSDYGIGAKAASAPLGALAGFYLLRGSSAILRGVMAIVGGGVSFVTANFIIENGRRERERKFVNQVSKQLLEKGRQLERLVTS